MIYNANFIITNKCNSRCRNCNIWANDKKNETNKLKRQLKKIKQSKSYKIGRKITLPARLIKGGIKCWKQHGFTYTCKLTVKKIVNKVR